MAKSVIRHRSKTDSHFRFQSITTRIYLSSIVGMGTRGFIVFVRKGKWYAMYQHYDAYDMWHNLSNQIADLMLIYSMEELLALFDKVQWHDGTVPPTPEEIELLKEYTNLKVASQSDSDWYCLLRGNQGSLIGTLECGHAMGDSGEGKIPDFNHMTCVVDFDQQLVGEKPFGKRQRAAWEDSDEEVDDVAEAAKEMAIGGGSGAAEAGVVAPT
jgi:hypothetical protein